MRLRSRKFSSKLEFRKQCRPRTCADRWRLDALMMFRKRRRAAQRRRALWLAFLLAWILYGTDRAAQLFSLRRKFNDENRYISPHATACQRPDESPPWAPRFSRSPVRRRDSLAASGRLTPLVRANRNTRSRSPHNSLCSNTQERPRVF